jgi:hypothetical protein
MTTLDFSTPLSTSDFVTELFCRVDDAMTDQHKHPQAKLYPSEVVTLGLLFALKGVGNRAFSRWARRDLRPLFPGLPERTRLFRLLASHHPWTQRFLAEPTLLGVADSFGIELLHPWRMGRSQTQIGKKGLSNHRWIVGGKLGVVLNRFGQVCAWDCQTANVHDSVFQPLIAQFDGQMLILTDKNFHTKVGDPANMKVCRRGVWNNRMLIETVLSMLVNVCHFKRVGHRVWRYFVARLAFTMAVFNLCIGWIGMPSDASGFVPLSMAQFSL